MSMLESGYRVDLSGSMDQGVFKHGPFRVWPSDDLSARSLVLNATAAFEGSDGPPRVIALTDALRLGRHDMSDIEVAWWLPFNFDPVPDQVIDALACGVDHVLALSKWAQDALARRDVESRYMPHGVDATVFTPADAATKVQARERLGLPADSFVVGMVAANNEWITSRKSFPEAFCAFAELRSVHSDALLYVHSSLDGHPGDGMNLVRLAESAGIPSGAIAMTNPARYRLGFDSEQLVALYRSFDVLLAPSAGEGFGVPVIEAQACGVPVIVSDFSAQPELVGDGWIVGGQRRWIPPVGSWQFTPDVNEIGAALLEAYKRPAPPSQLAVDFALRFDHSELYDELWRPFLADWLA
ncbi:glycosyltransferase [Candidatus Microthrix parvicella]|uniref:glycosyltransferase n=1 Tax=Candidatus Neomicrothrix parvicella TaxID=41950 RepID=UPI0012FD09FE|nr:glycosyltransferase [Candidatus Microthrix parvicella]